MGMRDAAQVRPFDQRIVVVAERVDTHDVMPVSEQPARQRASDETRRTRDERPHRPPLPPGAPNSIMSPKKTSRTTLGALNRDTTSATAVRSRARAARRPAASVV